ncbi:bromodomain adjacent to zinc finger domain protein 2B isoform X2 [Osmerus mordax]|uniref:bromodomain adjacent to zinc finger domain protein 2B isoform X2 n=1 Tax=Osmerus mordax TaxID=8014 RepID=UPI00350FA24B
MKGLAQGTSEGKQDVHPEKTPDSQSGLSKKHRRDGPFSRCLSSQAGPLPSAAAQAAGPLFQSPRSREAQQQHTSVIQATGLAVISRALPLSSHTHRESPCVPPRASPKHSSSSSPKHNSVSSSPKPLSLCTSPKPLSVASSPKPPSLSPSPKPPTLSPSHQPTRSRTSSPKPLALAGRSRGGSKGYSDDMMSHINSFRIHPPFLSQEHFKQAFPLSLKKQDSFKNQRKMAPSSSSSSSSSSSLPPPRLSPETLASHKLTSSLHASHSNLFLANPLLIHHHQQPPNGVIHSSVQEAPLALITRPRGQSSRPPSRPLLAATSPHFSMPINLSTGTKEASAGSVSQASTSPGLAHRPRKNKTPKALHARKPLLHAPLAPSLHAPLATSLVELVRGTESDIPSSKDSDDSLGDEDEDEDDEDDSDDSLSESDSNLESDSDGSEDELKEREAPDRKLSRASATSSSSLLLNATSSSSLLNASSGLSASCSPLNLQVARPLSLAPPTTVTSAGGALAFHAPPSSSHTLTTPPGSGKRRRVTDERELRLPLEFGWQRETRIRSVAGRLQGEVAYYAPCGKKLRQYPDVMKYISRNGIADITRDNFSFSTKIKVGDFYEAREGPQGLQWSLLTEEEIVPRIIAMDGRRGRQPNPDLPGAVESPPARRRKGRSLNAGEDFPGASDAKLLRKLEAQEIARQAAQIKMMRKLEKQALARAAKEARRQQAVMAAEDRRKRKEQMKILKQQEKIKRIQQIRMEKELRAQQILEDKEMRRQQAVLLKHQELERHRLDMERERRRQHMMLIKAMDARKKAEERERLKQEKKDEKRLNKERKLELRRLELEMAKELKKPNEDMCLADQKPLPELSRVSGLVLPGSTFSDCLMVIQFLRSFGKVLGLDVSAQVPPLSVLQEGLLNIGPAAARVQDLLVRMLSSAVCDPGLPPGHRTKTALGDHLTNVGINRDNVSEILQIFMEAHCDQQSELLPLAFSLKTRAFQAHTPAQKASILGFLVNELSCSKSVVSEIDKNIDHMTNLRKDKWFLEGNLRKLRVVHAKKTGKRDSSVGGEEGPGLGTPTPGRKRKRKAADSEEEEEEDEDSEEQGDEDEEEEEEGGGGKRGKKVETCEEEDDGDQTASVEELEKQLEKLTRQQSQIRRKLFESSHSLRSMMFGQDRYKRRYWVLPQCGGIFVEGMDSGEGPEELEKERQRSRKEVQVKEEQLEELEEKPGACSLELGSPRDTATPENQPDKDSLNLFLQKPGSFSKLSQLLEVAKMSPDSDSHSHSHGSSPAKPSTSVSSPVHASAQTTLPSSPSASASSLPGAEARLEPGSLHGAPYLSPGRQPASPQQPLLPSDQLLRVLTEKSGHWFSLLPRSPCDGSSVTSPGSTPSAPPSSSPPQPATLPRSPSALSPTPQAPSIAASPGNPTAAISPFGFTSLQLKSGLLMGLPFCGWPSGVMSPGLAFPGSPLNPLLGAAAYQPGEGGQGNPFLAPSISTSKSESPGPLGEKPPSAPSPAVELARNQDHASPLPIPEEMLCGWWRVSDLEELRGLVKALHSRGVREKALQKQIQKHMEHMAQACARNRDVCVIDERDLDQKEVNVETVESWCVEEQAMEVDISALQQVEEMERKVTSASLQVKGWMYPEPQSEREDLVYHEHKPWSCPGPGLGPEARQEQGELGGRARRPNNPLDIAAARLAELERNIERRYLKSPLSTTIQIRVDHVGTVTVPAPAPSSSGDGEGGEEELAPGMKTWRRALSEVSSAAQLALCLQQLHRSIAWERSIMKVYCQMCRKGDNEELLLLCDGCDKGCHTYCHKPKITTIPSGDWFCPACIAKASGQFPKSKKQKSRVAAGGGGGAGAGGGAGGGAGAVKRGSSEVKRSRKTSVAGEVSEDEGASTCCGGSGTPRKGSKESKKRRGESPPTNPPSQDSPASWGKKAKMAKDNNNSKDLNLCRVLLAELEGHQDAWPFLIPVNPKSVPGYKKVIRKPMDFSTIREKLVNNLYLNLETFIIDVNLVFDNCEKFNEDNSDIGRAGHSMRRFFERRWPELLRQII